MNPHYHQHPPYPDLNSPHSPNSDGMPGAYHGHAPSGGGGPPNGHLMSSHHDQLRGHPAYVGGAQLNHHHGGGGGGGGPTSLSNYHGHHHHYHQFLNNASNNNNNNNSNNQNVMCTTCAGCGNKIVDRYLLSAMEKHWHHRCLKCQLCQTPLADLSTSLFTKENMILCKKDYVNVFGPKCSSCGETISAEEMVMKAPGGGQALPSSPTNRGPLIFHLRCFSCCKCRARLIQGDRYNILSNGNLVCEKDWNSLYKGSSMSTGQTQTTGTTVRKGKVGRPRRSRD